MLCRLGGQVVCNCHFFPWKIARDQEARIPTCRYSACCNLRVDPGMTNWWSKGPKFLPWVGWKTKCECFWFSQSWGRFWCCSPRLETDVEPLLTVREQSCSPGARKDHSQWKMDVLKMCFKYWKWGIFDGYVSLLESISWLYTLDQFTVT